MRLLKISPLPGSRSRPPPALPSFVRERIRLPQPSRDSLDKRKKTKKSKDRMRLPPPSNANTDRRLKRNKPSYKTSAKKKL